jgi:hypothetical protein
MRFRLAMGVLVALFALPVGVVAQDDPVPFEDWAAGASFGDASAVLIALSEDVNAATLAEAEQSLGATLIGLQGTTPEPCYAELHGYIRLAVENMLVGVRLVQDYEVETGATLMQGGQSLTTYASTLVPAVREACAAD